jgi:hypothetical protein
MLATNSGSLPISKKSGSSTKEHPNEQNWCAAPAALFGGLRYVMDIEKQIGALVKSKFRRAMLTAKRPA